MRGDDGDGVFVDCFLVVIFEGFDDLSRLRI